MLTGGRLGRCYNAWKFTATEVKERGGVSEPHWWQDAATGWWISAGDDGDQWRLHKLPEMAF
jgi:hypothetical protein